VCSGEARERSRHVDRSRSRQHRARRGPDRHFTSQHALHRIHDVTRAAGRCQRPTRLRQERASRFAQPHAPCGADEQLRAQLTLERADGRGETRLHDVEARSRTREVLLLRNRDEVLELAEVH
jgi:hypothetical protein